MKADTQKVVGHFSFPDLTAAQKGPPFVVSGPDEPLIMPPLEHDWLDKVLLLKPDTQKVSG